MNTMKTNMKELKNQYIEKLTEVKKFRKLSAKQLETLSDLQLSDKWSDCIDLLEKIKNGQSVTTDYSFQETDDSYILTIPKSSIDSNSEFRIPEKGKSKIPYRVVFNLGNWGSEKVSNNLGIKFTMLEYDIK